MTGTITTPAAGSDISTGQTKLNYPAGYNRTNSVVLSIMGGKRSDSSILTTQMPVSATGMLLGASGLAVTLDTTNIIIRKEKVGVEEPASTVSFKLVLLKIT